MFIFCYVTIKISTMIKDLFTEICKRGCIIETKSKYPTDHLPKCLVTINDNIIKPECSRKFLAEFKISPIIPESVHLYFYCLSNKKMINGKLLYNGYRTTIIPECRCGRSTYDLIESKEHYHENMKLLDLITDYLYTNNLGNLWCGYPEIENDTLALYREKLKIKMILDFIDKGLFEFIHRLDRIFQIPKEIKLIIINMFIKLDNWHNVGISIDIFCSD